MRLRCLGIRGSLPDHWNHPLRYGPDGNVDRFGSNKRKSEQEQDAKNVEFGHTA